MSSNLTVSALRDMGCVRTNNEDNFAYDPANGIYIVCDGMGGMAAGEVASSIACNTVLDVFSAQPPETPILSRLSLAIHSANNAVRHSSQVNPEQHGMGTTLVAAVLEGTSKLIIGNVGDSRAYLLQNGACMQVTVDHSYINELVRNGTVKVEDIHSLNFKGMESVITRAIGAADSVDPDFFAIDLRENDTVLLCSDGLTRYVESTRLASLMDPADLDGSCQRLIQAAKDGGGADNITCLLLRYNAVVEGGETVAMQPIQTSVEELPQQAVAEPAAPQLEPVEQASEPVEKYLEPAEMAAEPADLNSEPVEQTAELTPEEDVPTEPQAHATPDSDEFEAEPPVASEDAEPELETPTPVATEEPEAEAYPFLESLVEEPVAAATATSEIEEQHIPAKHDPSVPTV